MPLTITVRELEQDPKLYDGKLVRVKAFLVRRDANLAELDKPFIYEGAWSTSDINLLPPIYLDDFNKASVRISERFLGRPNASSNSPFMIYDGEAAEAIVVGIFKANRCAEDNDRSDYVFHITFTDSCDLHIILKNAVIFADRYF